ncbi:MAG: hypothetical protein ACRDL7_02735 [Gaiellaceae bacterium]
MVVARRAAAAVGAKLRRVGPIVLASAGLSARTGRSCDASVVRAEG